MLFSCIMGIQCFWSLADARVKQCVYTEAAAALLTCRWHDKMAKVRTSQPLQHWCWPFFLTWVLSIPLYGKLNTLQWWQEWVTDGERIERWRDGRSYRGGWRMEAWRAWQETETEPKIGWDSEMNDWNQSPPAPSLLYIHQLPASTGNAYAVISSFSWANQ